MMRLSSNGLKMHTIFKTFFIFLLLSPLFPRPAEAEQVCKDSIIPTSPYANFAIHNDGTATDNTTGLMWTTCSIGQKWDKKTCSGSAELFSWAQALKAAAGYEYAGYTDWRMPNKNELESIVESRCFTPAINLRVFPATPSAFFWSSTPYAAVSDGVWSVDFGYGNVNASVKSGSNHIRLVRDGD